METKSNIVISSAFSLIFFSLLHLSTAFTPVDNYLIGCGSSSNTTVDNRVFVGDLTSPNSVSLSSGKSISLTNPSPSPNSTPLYQTARVFTSSSVYEFSIKKTGFHLVRFHFSPFTSQSYNLSDANFSVLANGFSLLRNFGVRNTVLKEFILMVSVVNFDISFVPKEKSDFAFVNAIEVFSAPDDLIPEDVSLLDSPNGVKETKNLSMQILEIVHRINVGGSKLTPFNDTLWRTWIPDENFLVLKSAAKIVTTTKPPDYEINGSSREIAPDNVYMTAQQMDRDNTTTDVKFNITWEFPVDLGVAQYFVRLHFCDIISSKLDELYFNVFINGFIARRDLDLSLLGFRGLASPKYLDFLLNSDNSGVLQINVGPSDLSSPTTKNAILNGVEIMKMENFVGSNARSKKNIIWVLVGSIVGGVVFLCLAAVAVFLVLRCRIARPAKSIGRTPLRVRVASARSRLSEGTALSSPGMNGYLCLRISFAEIQFATNNFDKNLIVGSGGFGMVYKGVLRNNTKVAVKRGAPGSRQGLPEFHSEITVLSNIRHLHLVSLVGYCEEHSEMILVYEYMEKGTLRKHLYGPGLSPLSWKQRLEICIGAARGLHYLHTGSAQGIIHRDIKSTNILLDENYVAKVADFGLSRSGPCLDETHVSTCVKGSFGYLDPEYFRRQQLTDKSDVYSFGVVLFEVLCARPVVDPLREKEQVNLAEWAIEWKQKGLLDQIIDPYLMGNIKPSSLRKFSEIAEKCVAEYGIDRPTMGDVLWNLENALQLQEDERQLEPHEDGGITAPELPVTTVVRIVRDDGGDTSDISTDQVFSQLMTNEGR